MLFVLATVFGQREASIWYFGNKAGLDFRTAPPVALYNSGISSLEGCAAISDKNGQILFYTNGVTINNRKHSLMKNGSGILGDLSSTSNAVIVPLPGSNTIYYLFTVGAHLQSGKGFRYSIIDMDGDSGFGEVIQKNTLVEASAYEKLAAIHHCNKKDVWITIRKWGTDQFQSYLMTAGGVSATPVISNSIFMPSNPIGALKFSANGKKLAAVYSYESNEVEVFDFDNVTGELTNSVHFKPDNTPVDPDEYNTRAYGAEFSPNGNILYISACNSGTDPAALYQFNVTINNTASILASKQVIANITSLNAGALQIAPDQKIYMALWKDNNISVIENPDVYGPGCNFTHDKISLTGPNNASSQFGLPGFIQSYFDPKSFYDFSRSGTCKERQVKFSLNKTLGIDSVKWDFGDAQTSQSLSPTNNYLAPGFYDVRLVVYKNDCSGQNDTVVHRIWIADKLDFLGPDTTVCPSAVVKLGIDELPEANYTWSTGETGNQIATGLTGTYWMEIEVNGCRLRDSIDLFPKNPPSVNVGPDTTVCAFRAINLIARTAGSGSYLWSTGETSSTISISKTGKYSVSVMQNGCSASDSLLVTSGDCEVFIPSAFTPNHDDRNETFGLVTEVALQYFSMQIFNKWGQLVFTSNDISRKWDGTFKGKEVPNGAYVWRINYVNLKDQKIYDQGSVLLIR